MATKQPKAPLVVTTLQHGGTTRKNIPTAEYQSVMAKDEQSPRPVAYPRANNQWLGDLAALHDAGGQLPGTLAQRLNRDLDPQPLWRGKDQQDWSELVVNAPPLYIQEKVHPKVLIDDLRRFSPLSPRGVGAGGEGEQPDLFTDFNGLPNDNARTEFYQHDAHWANRMILGDSLQVMASLAAREAGDAGFDVLIACAFNYDAHSSEFDKLGRIPVLKARMNADLHMADDLKNTGKGNLFVIFGEPDIDILDAGPDGAASQVRVKVNGVDVFHPNTGEVRSDGAEGIACWFIDTDYNEESFFVRHAYFLGANDPYKSLKTTLKAEIDEDAWATLNRDTSRPFDKPQSGRIAVKVINHLGDEVMKVFRV
jgi:hypothetical protein